MYIKACRSRGGGSPTSGEGKTDISTIHEWYRHPNVEGSMENMSGRLHE